MLMLCWFYCIPFAKFFYFALSGLMFIIALFALKRGIYTHRPGLRQFAFILMFIAAFKTLMIDFRMQKQYILCDYLGSGRQNPPLFPCSGKGMMAADFVGMLLFVLASLFLFYLYKVYMPEKKRELLTPDQVHLHFWTNLSLGFVVVMICWLTAPWFGYLTVGHVPKIFLQIPWQNFAIGNLGLLLICFWKSESCVWTYSLTQKNKMQYLTNTWTARDTLWMNLFLYCIALGFSYISHDVLTTTYDQLVITPQ